VYDDNCNQKRKRKPNTELKELPGLEPVRLRWFGNVEHNHDGDWVKRTLAELDGGDVSAKSARIVSSTICSFGLSHKDAQDKDD